MNTSGQKRRTRIGHQVRLDEVCCADDPTLRRLAAHHFSQLLYQYVGDAGRVLSLIKDHAAAKKPSKQLLRSHAQELARALNFAPRLEPGLAAIARISGGTLSPDLQSAERDLVRCCERLEAVRPNFSRPREKDLVVHSVFMEEVERRIEKLKAAIVSFYSLTQRQLGLPPLVCAAPYSRASR